MYRPPEFRFYNIDREVVTSLRGRNVGSRPNYDQLFEWFYARENEELRQQRDDKPSTKLADLSAVRNAIRQMIDGVSSPRISSSYPSRLIVSVAEGNSARDLAVEQLSDGYRGVLALAANIAHCMAVMSSSRGTGDPLNSEIIVLIDEIELHLHPAWQQRILTDLMRTFPNVQFIVSTHSPQVLSTVAPKHIVELARDGDGIVAGGTAAATYGAESGEILACVMGVEERPDNEFSKDLQRYLRLISDDLGESEKALEIRATLNKLSPQDPALDVADMEIRQRKLFRKTGGAK